MRRRLSAALTAVAAAALLTACAGLPTSGSVYPGRDPAAVDESVDVEFVPDRPQPGASPEQIVQGFLRAGTGSQDSWATAEEFLTTSFAEEWEPLESVTIDRIGDRSSGLVAESGDAASVGVSVVPTGMLDATGAYLPGSGSRSDLTFELAREDGEWRISAGPQGIVLLEEQFHVVFREAQLAYFDPSWQYLVPDVRWLPRTNVAAYVATRLIDGPPSPWLAGSVATAFTEGLAATPAARTGGVAEVELGEDALALGAETLGRMQAQLEASMRSVDVAAVRMTVDGSPLQATAAQTLSTQVDTGSIVQTAAGTFGFLDGDAVEPIGELSAAVESLGVAEAIELDPARDVAAVLTSSGTVVRARDDGAQPVLLDSRAALVAPTVDPSGTVWSVPGDDPSAVVAYPLSGGSMPVQNAWPEATAIRDLQLSRDGTRVAAVVVVRGRTEVWVSAVRRSDEGALIELGEPLVLATLAGEGVDLAWLDWSTVGVLERVGDTVHLREQPVGGPGTDLTVPGGVTQVVGGNSSARLLSDSGVLYVRQSTTWVQVAGGIEVLAAQQGRP